MSLTTPLQMRIETLLFLCFSILALWNKACIPTAPLAVHTAPDDMDKQQAEGMQHGYWSNTSRRMLCWQHGLPRPGLAVGALCSGTGRHGGVPFELDANPQDDNPVLSNDDWATPDSGRQPSSPASFGHRPRTIFEGATRTYWIWSKWSWKDGSVPDKVT